MAKFALDHVRRLVNKLESMSSSRKNWKFIHVDETQRIKSSLVEFESCIMKAIEPRPRKQKPSAPVNDYVAEIATDQMILKTVAVCTFGLICFNIWNYSHIELTISDGEVEQLHVMIANYMGESSFTSSKTVWIKLLFYHQLAEFTCIVMYLVVVFRLTMFFWRQAAEANRTWRPHCQKIQLRGGQVPQSIKTNNTKWKLS